MAVHISRAGARRRARLATVMEILILVACIATIAIVGFRNPPALRRAAKLTVIGLAASIALGVLIGLLLPR